MSYLHTLYANRMQIKYKLLSLQTNNNTMKIYSISIYLDTRRAKKNANFPVKLRVFISHPRSQKLYPTIFDFSIEEFNSIWKTNKPRKKYKEIREKLLAIEVKANKVADKLDIFTFEEFEKKLFQRIGDSTKVSYHYANKIEELKGHKQIKTASNYELSQKSILEFSEKIKNKKYSNLTLYNITSKWLDDYEFYMIEDKHRSPTTVSMYLRALRTIFNIAIDEKEIAQKYYPFGKRKYQVPASRTVKKALTKEQLKILHETVPKTDFEQKAKDFWFFSYSCNGINIKDIALLQYKNIDSDKIIFYRAKTKRTSKRNLKPIIVYLNDFSKSIIEKYGNENKESDDFVFDIISLENSAEEQGKKIQNFTRYINQHLKKLCKANDLPEDISTYWARHSFATNSIKNGASMEFISESLGHSGLNTTKNYFAGFDNETKKKFSETLMDFD